MNPLILPNGTRVWTDESGQASVIWTSGQRHEVRGLIHREEGPAVEGADGSKAWLRHGERHRDGGPAIEWANGAKTWFRNGVMISPD